MDTKVVAKIRPGDKIVLRTDHGPEESENRGFVVEVRKNGVLTDFGLTHKYVIPFEAIKTHYSLVEKEHRTSRRETRKLNSKNQLKL